MEFEKLKQLGFSKNEISVYLYLAQQGKSGAHLLSKKLLLPRSTVYSVLDSLERQNLISKTEAKRRTIYYIDNPNALSDLILLEESNIKERKKLAAELVAQITPFVRQSSVLVPKVEFFEGTKKVEKFLYAQLFTWRDSILRNDKTSWGFQDHSSVELFKDWFKYAWKILHLEAGISGCILSNQSSVEQLLKGKIPKRDVRILGNQINFEASTWVMGDYVVVIMTRRTPVYAFQIQEPLLAASLRILFKNLYQQANS